MIWGQSKMFPQHHMCKGDHYQWLCTEIKCSLLVQNSVFIYLSVSEDRYDSFRVFLVCILFDTCEGNTNNISWENVWDPSDYSSDEIYH